MRANWEKPKPKAKLSLLRSLCLYLQAGGPRQSNEKAYYTGLYSKTIFPKKTHTNKESVGDVNLGPLSMERVV